MHEPEVGQNVVLWKSDPSELAMPTVSCVEEAVVVGPVPVSEERRHLRASAVEQFDAADRGFADTDSHMTLTFMAPESLKDLQSFMAGLVEGVVRTNLRLARDMFQVQSPVAFAELYQRFMVEYFAAFQLGATALARAAAGTK
jgi:hypothetical protein